MRVRIDAVRRETALIKTFRLAMAEGGTFPPFAAGAHIRLTIPVDGRVTERAYSLWRDDEGRPHISVRREDGGRGGSLAMHALEEGTVVEASAPANAFPLAGDARDVVLISGGIGITPILAMAGELAGRGVPFRVHHTARSWGETALLAELVRVADGRITLYLDGGDPALGVPLDGVLRDPALGRQVYVCGPGGLIDAVTRVAAARGWRSDDVRFERFSAPAGAADDAAFEVFLARSDVTVTVEAGGNIIDALAAAGHEPLYSCRAGTCGICVSPVLASDQPLIHRDAFLSDAQRDAGDKICLCVSRAAGGRLTLDL